jgi:hypothetical protein
MMTITHPKHFKWLRLVLSSLKAFDYTEGDYPSRIDPNASKTDGAEYVTPNVVHKLTFTDAGVFYRSVDERLGWVIVKEYTFTMLPKGKVKEEKVEHQYFRSQEWIDKAKADFEQYLINNPNMREWGENARKNQTYELLPLDFYNN